jgi:predicted DNA-binding transcriptional regulator AlpA
MNIDGDGQANPWDAREPPRARERLLAWRTVRELTGLSRTTAWRLQKRGEFPLPVVMSPGRVGWRESEVEAWQASRAPRSTAADPPMQRRGTLTKGASDPPAVSAQPAALVEPQASPQRDSSSNRKSSSDQLGFDF